MESPEKGSANSKFFPGCRHPESKEMFKLQELAGQRLLGTSFGLFPSLCWGAMLSGDHQVAAHSHSRSGRMLRKKEKPGALTWWHPALALFSQRPQMVQNMEELRIEGKGDKDRLPAAQAQADATAYFWAALNSVLLTQEG